jgi:hypothetical protein
MEESIILERLNRFLPYYFCIIVSLYISMHFFILHCKHAFVGGRRVCGGSFI